MVITQSSNALQAVTVTRTLLLLLRGPEGGRCKGSWRCLIECRGAQPLQGGQGLACDPLWGPALHPLALHIVQHMIREMKPACDLKVLQILASCAQHAPAHCLRMLSKSAVRLITFDQHQGLPSTV